jgi:hypothetical protein
MKHYILVSITIPEKPTSEKGHLWLGFRQALAERLKQHVQSGRLAENVWLLDRDNDVKFFAFLVHEAEQSELPLQVRFLTEDDQAKPNAGWPSP